MKRRGRVRRVAKWAGLAVCALSAGLWAVNTRWDLGCTVTASASWRLQMDIERGALCVEAKGPASARRPPLVQRTDRGLADFRWLPDWERRPSLSDFDFEVPLWMFAAGFAVPTAWLWVRRRTHEGRCAACGYSLAGLAPGAPCPECGKIEERGGRGWTRRRYSPQRHRGREIG